MVQINKSGNNKFSWLFFFENIVLLKSKRSEITKENIIRVQSLIERITINADCFVSINIKEELFILLANMME